MDPLTITALVMMGAGTAMEAAGQYQQSKIQQQWAEYNAAVSKYETAVETQKMRKGRLQLLSAQRARYAKAGIEFTGTPLEVMTETADQLEQEIAERRRAGEIESQMATYQGKVAKQTGAWSAGTSLLTGGAGILGAYHKLTS